MKKCLMTLLSAIAVIALTSSSLTSASDPLNSTRPSSYGAPVPGGASANPKPKKMSVSSLLKALEKNHKVVKLQQKQIANQLEQISAQQKQIALLMNRPNKKKNKNG